MNEINYIGARIIGLRFAKSEMTVKLSDEKEFSYSSEDLIAGIGNPFSFLKDCTEEERNNWKIIGNGIGIYWDAINELYSISDLDFFPNPKFYKNPYISKYDKINDTNLYINNILDYIKNGLTKEKILNKHSDLTPENLDNTIAILYERFITGKRYKSDNEPKTSYNKIKSITPISYSELLQTIEWDKRRDIILKRDGYCCSKCGISPTFPIKKDEDETWINLSFLSSIKVIDGSKTHIVKVLNPTISSKPYWLHVHHKYYVLENLPWIYPDESLITMCNWCHFELHEKERVPVFNKEIDRIANQTINLVPCSRCKGAGIFPEFRHIQDGICFRCQGAKYENLIGKGYNI